MRTFLSTRSLAITIMVIATILAITSVWNDSLIVDEDPHIGAGYSYLVMQDMRLNPEHPPLAKDLAALPLLFLDLDQTAFQSKAWQTDINGQWEFGRKLIYNSGNNADLITHAAKIPMLIFFIGSAIIIFIWSRKLWGDRAALLALTLFSFSPTIMAHARFVTTDMAALFGVLSATYFFTTYLQQPTRRNFWLASVFFGIALICKFSTILLVPLFIVLALIWNYRFLLKTALVIITGFVIIVWPVYFFHTRGYPPERQHRDTAQLLSVHNHQMLARGVVWASDKPVLRAAAQYGLGLMMVQQRSTGGNTVYFKGTITNSAGSWYFPFVYFVKEPLAWWGLVIIALCALILKLKSQNFKLQVLRFKIKDHLPEVAMLLWLAMYWAVSITSTLNIGVRHLLPVYPFIIMLVAGQVSQFAYRVARYALYILLAWYVLANLSVYPFYLTYFNQTVGGASGGHEYVVDSNLDWGQDLKRFANWTKDNNIKKIELDYFGWADQYYYLGDRFLWLNADKYKSEADFKARNTSDGWIAVSATYLMNESKTKYAWLYAHKPITVIGNSIFVYRIL
ncbi:MAG: glycosyltransferase family 39 protein [Patescibacteria group bacterium]